MHGLTRITLLAVVVALTLQTAQAVTGIATTGAVAGEWTADINAARRLALTNNTFFIINFGRTIGCNYCDLAAYFIYEHADFSTWARTNGIALVYADYNKGDADPLISLVRRLYPTAVAFPTAILVDGRDGVTKIGQFMVRYSTSPSQKINGIQFDQFNPLQFAEIVNSFVIPYYNPPTQDDSFDPGDDTVSGAVALAMAGANQTHGPHKLKNSDTNDWFVVTNMTAGVQYRVSVSGLTVANTVPRINFYADYTSATNQAAWTNMPLVGLLQPYTFTAAQSGTSYIRVTRPPTNNADVAYTLNYRIFENCTVGFAVTDLTVDEDATNALVEVTRTGRLTDAVAVSYATQNGTATAGQDYVATNGVISFAANQTSRTIPVRLLYSESQTDFSNETFNVTLSPTNDVSVTPGTTTVTLRDVDKTRDDADPADDVRENATVLNMGATNRVTELHYLSAADTQDWFVFNNIATGMQYRVSVIDLRQSNAEPTAEFSFADLTGFSSSIPLANLGTGFVFTVANSSVTNGLWLRISRPDGTNAMARYRLSYREWQKPGIGFASGSAETAENSGSVTLPVIRTVNAETRATVSYQTVEGTALAGADYVAKTGTLTFEPGMTNLPIQVTIRSDNGIWRGDRQFGVRLTLGADAVAGLTNTVVTLLERDPADDANDRRLGGDDTFAVATPLLMARSNRLVSGLLSAADTNDWYVFTNALRGSEYRVAVTGLAVSNASNLTASFYVSAPGGGLQACDWLTNSIPLAALDAYFFRVPEALEPWDGNVWLSVSRDSGERVHVAYTLNYREWVPCEIGFEANSFTVSEAASEVVLRVRRVAFAELATSAQITTRDGTATAGDDYTQSSQTLSWLPDDPDVKTVRIPLRNYDTQWEGNERFFVELVPDPDTAMAGAFTNVEVTLTEKDTPVPSQIAFAGIGEQTNAYSSAARIIAKEGTPVVFWLERKGGRAGAVSAVLTWTDGVVKTSQTNLLWQSLEMGLKRVEATVASQAGYQPSRNVTMTLTAVGAAAVKGKDTALLTVADDAVTQPLAAYSALDMSRVPFRSTSGAWFCTGDGSVLRSVPPAKGVAAVMLASVTGVGTLVFDAAVMRGDPTCVFSVKVGSARTNGVSAGENRVAVPAGVQTVTWSFTRGAASDPGAYAQVSNVRWESADSRETVGVFNGWAWRRPDGVTNEFGLASMTVAASGKLSGKLQYAGQAYAFTAAGYDAGTYTVSNVIAKSGRTQLVLAIAVDASSGCAEITEATGNFGAVLHRNGWSDKPLSAHRAAAMRQCEGYYTTVLSDENEADDDAFGSGYLAFTVAPSGSIKVGGKLADDMPVSLSGTLLLDADGVPYTVFFNAPASYAGGFANTTVMFGTNGVGVSVLTGGGIWVSRNGRATASGGFERTLEVAGGYYNKTKTLADYYLGNNIEIGELAEPPQLSYTYRDGLTRETRWTNAIFWAASDGPLALTVGTGLQVAQGGTAENPAYLTISANPLTGLFSGKFRVYYVTASGSSPATTYKTVVYQGALVSERAEPEDGVEGRGFYLLQDRAEAGYLFNRSYDFVIEEAE